jgi:hypothetical protein
MSDDTRSSKILQRLNNNRFIAAGVVVGSTLIAIVTFNDAAIRLVQQIRGVLPTRDFVVAGEIIPESGAAIPSRIAVAIQWGVDRSTGGDTAFQDSHLSVLDPGTGRLAYSISLSAPPADEVLMDIDGVRLGVGYIVAFGDLNSNGILDEGEPIVGAAAQHAITLIYAAISGRWPIRLQEVKRNRLYTLLSLPQGYALDA